MVGYSHLSHGFDKDAAEFQLSRSTGSINDDAFVGQEGLDHFTQQRTGEERNPRDGRRRNGVQETGSSWLLHGIGVVVETEGYARDLVAGLNADDCGLVVEGGDLNLFELLGGGGELGGCDDGDGGDSIGCETNLLFRLEIG